MSIRTNWLSPPRSIKGQDQLGSQAPCEMTYSQLLPGITNVTERARYFSFYTWVTWSFDHRLKNLGPEEYVEHFRRADCLYTLIAAHEATSSNYQRPAERMVGRLKLSPAVGRLEEDGSLRLSDYATLEDNGSRYFQNELGGLGQYYAGPLMELGLCKRASSGPWIQYSKTSGSSLAEAVQESLPVTEFWEAVEKDLITVETLTRLHDFAPRRLINGSVEHRQLLDIMLERDQASNETKSGSGSAERRKTLGLILHLAREMAETEDASLHEWIFRPAVYASALPGRAKWNVPPFLQETRNLWSLYERNDLLSIGCQAIFCACLFTLESDAGDGRVYDSVEQFARSYSKTLASGDALASLDAEIFGALVERVEQSGPAIEDLENPLHEFQLELQVHDLWRNTSDMEILISCAVRLLGTLAARGSYFPEGYGNLAIASASLSQYPIQLESFDARAVRWRSMSLAETLRDLIGWVLNAHLSVALRKLAQTRSSSFHLRPTEHGLQVVNGIPDPARSLPRLTQAMRILEDLCALEEVGEDHLIKITPLGKQLLEEILA